MNDRANNKRLSPRIRVDANVQLRVNDHISIFARATEISRTGIRIRLHGGARLGERYRVLPRPGLHDGLSVEAEVRWVGKPDIDGGHPVGLKWVDAPDTSPRRIEMFMRELAPSR